MDSKVIRKIVEREPYPKNLREAGVKTHQVLRRYSLDQAAPHQTM
jgi:hypothetical protein